MRPGGAATSGSRQEVERLIAKGWLKEAVKEAKLCYKKEESPEHHRLLERAYLLRAGQLRRDAMPAAAREVAQHLLDFGVTDPALVEEAAGLLLALGMPREALALQGRLDSPEARARLARQEADLAVLHPELAATAPPEVRQGAAPVRSALEALQAGDEAKALDALRDVSRGSPFADWKLFARGLAAFSRREVAEARANWDRLDPDRAASRIARGLLSLSGQAAEGGEGKGPDAGIKLDALERRVFGEPVLETLEQLRAFATQGRWDDAVRRVATLRNRLVRIDPKLAERLTRVLYEPVIQAASRRDYYSGQALVREFTRVAEPLPIDPRWNRFHALLWEGPQGGLDEAEDYWRAYLKDLEDLPGLKAEERTLARALVLKHLGTLCIDAAESLAEPPFGPFESRPRPSPRELRDERKRAVACLEESLRLAPEHRETYKALRDAYEDWDQPEQAVAVARRLLEKFPDDFETVMFLSEHHFRRDESEPALEYAKRARALKPLDESAAQHECAVHLIRARDLAQQKRWDEGRAEFAAAEAAWPEWCRGAHYQARRAVFELKAGQGERAEALIADALAGHAEPATLWLALLIEAIRYKLPKEDRERFEARWHGALSKKVRSETAGAMAKLLASFLGGGFEYPGRATHVKLVVEYLRRTTRIKYRREDLIAACSFLGLVPKERDLFEKLVKRGLKLFPDSPVFLMMAGSLELEKGPFAGGNLRLARTHFEKALERARASRDPDDARLLPKIQESLSMLTDLISGPMGMPFGGFGGGPSSFAEMMGAMAEMMDFDLDDEDDEDDEPPRRPSSQRRGRGRS